MKAGRDSGTMRVHVDVAKLRSAALSAMARARFTVKALPVGDSGFFTIASEDADVAQAGFDAEQAERYADCINNEAVLARNMLLVLAELTSLQEESRRLRDEDDSRQAC